MKKTKDEQVQKKVPVRAERPQGARYTVRDAVEERTRFRRRGIREMVKERARISSERFRSALEVEGRCWFSENRISRYAKSRRAPTERTCKLFTARRLRLV